jgi:hypothetical protein
MTDIEEDVLVREKSAPAFKAGVYTLQYLTPCRIDDRIITLMHITLDGRHIAEVLKTENSGKKKYPTIYGVFNYHPSHRAAMKTLFMKGDGVKVHFSQQRGYYR